MIMMMVGDDDDNEWLYGMCIVVKTEHKLRAAVVKCEYKNREQGAIRN
jgi:hypothetical protein